MCTTATSFRLFACREMLTWVHCLLHQFPAAAAAAAAALLERGSAKRKRGRPKKKEDHGVGARVKSPSTPQGSGSPARPVSPIAESPLDDELAALKAGEGGVGLFKVAGEEPRVHHDISVGCLVKAADRDGLSHECG